MPENKLLVLSFEFAVAIVNLADNVKMPKSSYMTEQLARAGASVGANIYEAQYAQSKKGFHIKLGNSIERGKRNSLLAQAVV
jgi:four helix bundle protein